MFYHNIKSSVPCMLFIGVGLLIVTIALRYFSTRLPSELLQPAFIYDGKNDQSIDTFLFGCAENVNDLLVPCIDSLSVAHNNNNNSSSVFRIFFIGDSRIRQQFYNFLEASL